MYVAHPYEQNQNTKKDIIAFKYNSVYNSTSSKLIKYRKHAGAELCQAQVQLWLRQGLNLVKFIN